MPSLTTQSSLSQFSPAELSYLSTSLSLQPPIRPSGRHSRQFRPLTAEIDVLPSVNGSAHLGFEDGGEAVVGVRAEVERTATSHAGEVGGEGIQQLMSSSRRGRQDWVALALDIAGTRDDDTTVAFLSEMLREGLVAGMNNHGGLGEKLVINGRWHWNLYIDVLLLSPLSPTFLPLPLLSLTTHLALLSTRLPRLKSEAEEDPMFDDDWEASEYLYTRASQSTTVPPGPPALKPPITLLVAQIGINIIFDPSTEELAVAEGIVAVTVGPTTTTTSSPSDNDAPSSKHGRNSDAKEPALSILAIRTINPAARDTFPGVARDGGAGAGAGAGADIGGGGGGGTDKKGVWTPPRGGIKRSFLKDMMAQVVDVAVEVMGDLEGFITTTTTRTNA